ncbi:MAG: hypothetical protein Q7U76_11000 [Nitrospirota bacterium]|nr:hypothetical protein [Nitrospirota bacterium]
MPALSVPLVTLSVTTPFPVPEAGLSVNQGALSLAVHVSMLLPVLLMLKVWGTGLAQPIVAAKERLAGLAPRADAAGGAPAAARVKVTGTVREVAPGAVMVTVVL